MKRITFITGHYGSGKSEFAVNFAIQKGVDYLIDLDIVNPYFRSREVEDLLKAHQIKTISSTVEKALGSDLPFISPLVFSPFREKTIRAVYDLGGDPVGARLLRQFGDEIRPDETDLLLAVNVFREATADCNGIMHMIEDIETSGGMKITGLIHSSNLLRDTTYQDLLYGEKVLLEVRKKTGLEILYTGIWEKILNQCGEVAGEVVPLKLYLRKNWL